MEKYDMFIQWAKVCGHWQVAQLSENFELFLQNVPEDIQEKVLNGDRDES